MKQRRKAHEESAEIMRIAMDHKPLLTVSAAGLSQVAALDVRESMEVHESTWIHGECRIDRALELRNGLDVQAGGARIHDGGFQVHGRMTLSSSAAAAAAIQDKDEEASFPLDKNEPHAMLYVNGSHEDRGSHVWIETSGTTARAIQS
jgi:hypothetical protein